MRKILDPFISLIIPVYKQERQAVVTIKHLQRVLGQTNYRYEIIVVVDGALDADLSKFKKLQLPQIFFLSYAQHQGKAYALRFGMSRARGDYIMFLDSGREINPNGVAMLLEHLKWYDADVIVGSKRHPASKVVYPLSRKILSWGYYFLVKFLFGIKVHDTQAGIKVFRRHVLKKILPRLVEKKFAGDLEMLVVANRLGFSKIYEAPVKLNYHLGSVTEAATVRSIARILVDTLAIYYRLHILRYYDGEVYKTFSSTAFSG